jgi:hypothetical protein
MRKIIKNRFRVTFILLLVLISSLIAIQWRHDFSYLKPSAPMIENTMPMAQTSQSSARLHYGSADRSSGSAGGGGVQFDQTAQPAPGLSINALDLKYNPNLKNGSRLELKINGTEIKTALPDWLLIPIANFTNHEAYSCFTLFGWLMNLQLEEALGDSTNWAHGVRIMNYHPKFFDTLLGLRLFHMDILIHGYESYSHIVSLPQENGKYVLGQGETAPDTIKNYQGLYNFSNYFNAAMNSLKLAYFRSWMVSDFTRNIQFIIKNDSLQITATPYYFFWRYKSDTPDYDIVAIQDSIIDAVNSGLPPTSSAQRTWLIGQLINSLRDYELKHAFYLPGSTVYDAVRLKTDADRHQFLNLYTTQSLYELLIHLLTYMDYFTVVHLDELGKSISNHPELLRAINPAVWDATVTTMRLAAFFRYIKENYPVQWQNFTREIQDQTVTPAVETPTVMYPTNDRSVTALLAAYPNLAPKITGLPDVSIAPGATVAMNLNDYISDGDSYPRDITWKAEILETALSNSSLRKNLNLSINPSLILKNKSLPFENRQPVNTRVQKVIHPEPVLAAPINNSGVSLSVEIDPMTQIAHIIADSTFDPVGVVQIRFSATDQTGLSDQQIISVRKNNVTIDENSTTLKTFNLYQNFPNPFNSSTIIKYEIPNQAQVQITLYNVRGELVQVIVDEEQPAGQYARVWNGLDRNGNVVGSGVYFCVQKVWSNQKLIFQDRNSILLIK